MSTSNYSDSTCKVEVVIVSQGDAFFLKKIKDTLLASTSFETPIISVREWLSHGNEMMLSYMGMITIAESIASDYGPEEIGYSVSKAVSEILGGGDPLLMSRSVLVCKQEDTDSIKEYCSAHAISTDIFTNEEPMVLCWSTWKANYRTIAKKLTHPITCH
jgi:hypothetical protein